MSVVMILERECKISYEAGLMWCLGTITEEVAEKLVPRHVVPELVKLSRICWEAGLEAAPMPHIFINNLDRCGTPL